MHFFFITLLLSISCVHLHAQTENSKQLKARIRVMPSFSFDVLSPSSDLKDPYDNIYLPIRGMDYDDMDVLFQRPSVSYGYRLEFDRFNYTASLDFEFFINNKISLNSGLRYSNKDFSVTPDIGSGDISSTGQNESLLLGNKADYKSRYLEIPLSLRLYHNLKKIELFLDLGLISQFNILSKDNVTPYLVESFSNDFFREVIFPETLTPEKIVFKAKFGIGASYKLNLKSGLQLSVNYNYGLTDSFDAYLPKYSISLDYLQTKISYYIEL